MLAQTQLKKPSNWQDFEKLSKLLWGEVWGCPDTIKRNGRQGQAQNGVDVYAYIEDKNCYYGIQCKGKDDYTNVQLTEAEIDGEIAKVKNFTPPLERFIFATTANKNAKIEEYIRQKNIESINNGGFRIYLSSWEDIVDLMEQYRSVYNWYVNNCQFKDNTDVSVTFDGKEETVIHPEYIKTTTRYKFKLPPPPPISMDNVISGVGNWVSLVEEINKSVPKVNIDQSAFDPFHRKCKHDYRWCRITIRIENTGSTVMRSPKLKMWFNSEYVADIDDLFRYNNTFGLDESAKAQINVERVRKRELFQTYNDVIEYRPKDSTIVQNDDRRFTISIKPQENIKEFPILWSFLCEDYKKDGILNIIVEPNIEEKNNVIMVDEASKVKDNVVEIVPKNN